MIHLLIYSLYLLGPTYLQVIGHTSQTDNQTDYSRCVGARRIQKARVVSKLKHLYFANIHSLGFWHGLSLEWKIKMALKSLSLSDPLFKNKALQIWNQTETNQLAIRTTQSDRNRKYSLALAFPKKYLQDQQPNFQLSSKCSCTFVRPALLQSAILHHSSKSHSSAPSSCHNTTSKKHTMNWLSYTQIRQFQKTIKKTRCFV